MLSRTLENPQTQSDSYCHWYCWCFRNPLSSPLGSVSVFYHIDFTTAFKSIPNGMVFLAGFLNQPIQPVASWGWLVDPKRHAGACRTKLSCSRQRSYLEGGWKLVEAVNGPRGMEASKPGRFFFVWRRLHCPAGVDIRCFFLGVGGKSHQKFESWVTPQKMVHPTKKKRRGGGGIYYWHSNLVEKTEKFAPERPSFL